jgi:hypothetical protein
MILCTVFVLKFQNFPFPHEIRKDYGSMTPGAYGTPRTSGAPGTLEIYWPKQSSQIENKKMIII